MTQYKKPEDILATYAGMANVVSKEFLVSQGHEIIQVYGYLQAKYEDQYQALSLALFEEQADKPTKDKLGWQACQAKARETLVGLWMDLQVSKAMKEAAEFAKWSINNENY